MGKKAPGGGTLPLGRVDSRFGGQLAGRGIARCRDNRLHWGGHTAGSRGQQPAGGQSRSGGDTAFVTRGHTTGSGGTEPPERRGSERTQGQEPRGQQGERPGGVTGSAGVPPPQGSTLRSPLGAGGMLPHRSLPVRSGARAQPPATPLHHRGAPTPPPLSRRCHPGVSPLPFPSPYLRLLGRRRPLCRYSRSPSPAPPPLPAAPAAASREWGG